MWLTFVSWPLVVALQGTPAPDQRIGDVPDLMRRMLGRPPPADDERRGDRGRSILPTIGASPDAGVSFGVLLSAQERADGPSSPLSVLTVGASYSTEQRVLVSARLDQHVGGDAWRIVGDWRFYKFTESTYGLGSDTTRDARLAVPLYWGRAHATLYRRIAGPLAVGGGYRFDVREAHDVGEHPHGIADRLMRASGMSIDALVDSRDNAINATKGWFGRASLAWFPQSLGSDRSWQSLQLEGRSYVSAGGARRHTLAFWTVVWITTTGDPTYFDLPSTAGDLYGRTARGYAAGRYRGHDWIDGEGEYRVELVPGGFVGAVVFASASTFSDARGQFGSWAPAGGFGLRVKLDKRHRSNLCVDYAWGREGARGLFLALNEAF